MNITPIIEAVISLAIALITAYLIPYIKSKHDSEKINKILSTVDILVSAAEQIGVNVGLTGEAKKEYVVKRLAEIGYTIDNNLDDYIEAAVMALHNELVK